MQNILLGFFFAALIVIISYRVKFLTLSGSIATFLLAGVIFSLGGIKWSVPILTFFILSSILSKLRKKKNQEVELYFEKTGVRDYMQVIANGGAGGALVILYTLNPNEFYYLIYLATLSAVCADTWATEIGTRKKTPTYNILNLKPIEQGISGGISWVGSVGAVMGSAVIAFSGFAWNSISVLEYFVLIIISGVLGSFFDSLLGATIQAQNLCVVCSKITEKKIHCGSEANHHRGKKWINNDVVNLLSGIAGGVVIVVLKMMIR